MNTPKFGEREEVNPKTPLTAKHNMRQTLRPIMSPKPPQKYEPI